MNYDPPKPPPGHWLCDWCKIYGNINHARAYRPDSEEPVETVDGEKICQQCAEMWWENRKKQAKLREKHG